MCYVYIVIVSNSKGSGVHRAALGGSREALLRLKQRAAVRRSVSTLSIDAPEATDGLTITCAFGLPLRLPIPCSNLIDHDHPSA